MAIGGGKVLAVGANDEIKRLASPKTRLRDLNTAKTRTIRLPGFNDAHTHLGEADAPAQRGPDRRPIPLRHVGQGTNLHQERPRRPVAHWRQLGSHVVGAKNAAYPPDLDKVTTGHPAFLDRIDGHIAVANSAALAAAGITGKTTPPQGGAIDLDANGEPTGILRESAQELVQKIIPPPSHAERRRGDELAIADALAHGVTSVQDFSDWQDFWSSSRWKRRANSICASPSGCPSTLRCPS